MSEKREKILVIGPCYPYRGGIATFVAFVCNQLSKNFDVKLFNYKVLYPSLLFPGKTQYDLSDKVFAGFKGERVINSVNPFNWYIVAKKIKNENPDLILMDWWNPFFGFCFSGIYFFLSKRLKKKIVIIAENVVSHEGRWIDKTLTRIGITIAREYIVLSDEVKKQLQKFSGNKPLWESKLPIYDYNVNKQPDTIENIKNQFCIKADEKVILFFGYVRKYKGLDILLKAVPLLKKEFTKLKVLVAGEFYEDFELTVSLINMLDIKNEVLLFNKFIPNEDVRDFFLIADVVALPYRAGTQSGIINLAYGNLKPVVVTDVGGLGEFVINKKTGILVNDVTPGAFAKGVAEFFKLSGTVNFTAYIKEYFSSNDFSNFNSLIKNILSGKK